MGRPPHNPTGPMTPAERQKRWREDRRKRVGKSDNRKRRAAYKLAKESAQKQAARAAAVERRAISRAAEPLLDPLDLRIGDCREVLADVADNSVALILTDPPYAKAADPLYLWLAEFAARVLIPGGALICYVGHPRLIRTGKIFEQQLRYHWTMAMLHDLDKAQKFPGNFNMSIGFKPVLFFTKGRRRGRTLLPDVLCSPELNKELHNWGQGDGGIGPLIEHLTEPGELIVDPFAGTADWGRRARKMGRRWLGADIVAGGSTTVRASK